VIGKAPGSGCAAGMFFTPVWLNSGRAKKYPLRISGLLLYVAGIKRYRTREHPMSTKIYITCPESDIAVWTGFRAPPGTGLAALKQVTLKKCPGCGNAHDRNAADAYWEQDLPPPPPSFWGTVRNRLLGLDSHA
jgi:hypothetical protein